MNYLIEISIFVVLFLFVLIEVTRKYVLKKNSDSLLTGLISMLLLVFGLYLLIKYGLILDYGTAEEIKSTHAELMSYFAITSLLTGLGFILISILKFIIWKIKEALTRNQ